MRTRSMTLAARYLFPVEGPPIADGQLTIQEGRIVHVGRSDGRAVDIDMGNAAILPGFVNAHTHLELASIKPDREAGEGSEDEIEWLLRVIGQRKSRSGDDLRAEVGRNIALSTAAGTTMIADTTTAGLSWGQIAEAPMRGLVFAELIGLNRMRGLHTEQEALEWLGTINSETNAAANILPGLSPHAPYSTAGWLYHRAVASRLPLSTHLAEMPEELELLKTRDGRLREFLDHLGAWDEDWEPIGPRPADYIRRGELRNADWLIAHGTYLDPDDFWQLRPEAGVNGHRTAVAYCPRTHARFGHDPHPFRAMLEHGVVVCLGTDSLASSPSLGILDEIRFLRREDASLGGPLLLTMATLFGAWALKAETVVGSLKVGKAADLAIVALPDREAQDPHDLLLDSEEPVIATAFEGAFVAGPWVES